MDIETFSLWPTPIYKLNTKDWLDVSEIYTELLCNISFKDTQLLQFNNIDSNDIPLTQSILQIQHEKVWKSLEEFCGRGFREKIQSSWMFYSKTGEGLEPHLHSGSALFTSALYLTDSSSDLVLLDPRFNACRGYPEDVRHKHFSPFRIKPKAGDLYLFPCYVQHHVASGPTIPRLSILTDYYFETV